MPEAPVPPPLKPQHPPTQQESEDARISAGQRGINRIWEYTQSYISVTVVTAGLVVAASLALRLGDTSSAFALLSNTMFVVIGFYFGRTNHQRVGGVAKDTDKIEGR